MAASEQPTIYDRFHRFWTARDTRQRAIIFGVLGVIVIAVVLASASSRPQWAPLYTDLDESDFNAIINQLEAERLPYEIGPNLILVPRDQLYQMRARLAENGLPVGDVRGLELFDERQLGLTDQEFQQKRERALQGEIIRMIRGLRGVQDAKIGIVFPEKTLFKEDESSPTAAVQIDYAGAEIPQHQVDAVALMVSHCVEDLGVEDIVITDTRGNYYKATGEGTDGIDTSEVLAREQFRQEREGTLEKALQALLDRAVGPSRSAVKVSVELTWDRQSEESVDYANDADTGKPYISHQKNTETEYEGSYPGGLEPGVAWNMPTASPESPLAPIPPTGAPGVAPTGETTAANAGPTYPEGGEGVAKMEYSDDDTDYLQDKLTTTKETSPPRLDRVSIGILLDEEQVDAAKTLELEPTIRSMAGLSTQRGDELSITRIAFYSSPDDALTKGFFAKFGTWIVPALMALIGLGGIVMTHRACNPPIVEKEEEAEIVDEDGEEIPGYSLDDLIADRIPTEDELAAREAISKASEAFDIVTEHAREHPEAFAGLLRTWLIDD